MNAGADALLFELGTEELPPKALVSLAEALGHGLRAVLAAEGLCETQASLSVFAAPRRLAVRIEAVLGRQPDRDVERRGPPLAAAFDAAGAPTKALLGFARSAGVAIENLEQKDTGKGVWLVHRERVRGQRLAAILETTLGAVLQALPVPRRMRWGSGSVEFVRPVLWCVLLHGRHVLPISVLGLKAGRHTRGHRFMAPGRVALAQAADYEDALEQVFVVADPRRRRQMIAERSQELAHAHGLRARIRAEQLDEVTGLVEWPQPLLGTFESDFLALPPEVLVSAMERHQKYFPVESLDGQLAARFITVTNLQSRNPDSVRAGNERVLAARFSDARFFWEQDRRTRLDQRVESLHAVAFQDKLGSLHDKTLRVQRLVVWLARRLGVAEDGVARAALLAKTDLRTGLVGEFPELQGTLGRYYALADGEDATVAQAIQSHYAPRSAQDLPPNDLTGALLGIADRLDTLTGMFGLTLGPTGDKDPFGLRRAALGVLRILLESPVHAHGTGVDLPAILNEALRGYAGLPLAPDAGAQVYDFIVERARNYLQAEYAADEIEAVLAIRPACLHDLRGRLDALHAFRDHPDAPTVIAANRRIRNILKQEDPHARSPATQGPAPEPAEATLRAAWQAGQQALGPLLQAGHHADALKRLAELGPPLSTFFDQVLVMSDDAVERARRLRLLADLRALFLTTADLSQLKDTDHG